MYSCVWWFWHKKSVNRLLIAYFTLEVRPKTIIPNKRKQFTPRGREPPQLIPVFGTWPIFEILDDFKG